MFLNFSNAAQGPARPTLVDWVQGLRFALFERLAQVTLYTLVTTLTEDVSPNAS